MEQMIFKDLPPSPPPIQYTKRIGGETRRGLNIELDKDYNFIKATLTIEEKKVDVPIVPAPKKETP